MRHKFSSEFIWKTEYMLNSIVSCWFCVSWNCSICVLILIWGKPLRTWSWRKSWKMWGVARSILRCFCKLNPVIQTSTTRTSSAGTSRGCGLLNSVAFIWSFIYTRQWTCFVLFGCCVFWHPNFSLRRLSGQPRPRVLNSRPSTRCQTPIIILARNIFLVARFGILREILFFLGSNSFHLCVKVSCLCIT